MKRAAVFTVIFPGNLPFFQAYLESLAGQTERDFDVVLLIDGVVDIENRLASFRDSLNFICYTVKGSIAQVREYGFEMLRQSAYDYIIFSDTDDVMSSDRIQVCVEALETYPVVVNDLVPFEGSVTHEVGYWSPRLGEGYIFEAGDIERYNFAGLGNGAIRKPLLELTYKLPELKALDWFVFYQWLQRNKGRFLSEGKMFYRQHASNLAGMRKLGEDRLNFIFQTKIEHYQTLMTTFPRFRRLRDQEVRKQQQLLGDKRILERTLTALNAQAINYFWWEETEYINE